MCALISWIYCMGIPWPRLCTYTCESLWKVFELLSWVIINIIPLDYFSLSRLSFTQWVYWGPTEIPRILKTLYFYTGIFLLIQPCSMLKIIFIVIRSFDAKEFESNYWIRNAIILHLHLIRQVNIYIYIYIYKRNKQKHL